MDNIAQNIKYLRKTNGLTQDDLAKKVGVSRYKIGSYEEGRAMPKLSLLQFMADYFQLTLDDFVNKPLQEGADGLSQNISAGMAGLRVLTTVVNSDNQERFVVVPDKAAAGYTTGYADPDYIEKLPVFDLPLPEFRTNGTYRVFQISGDSMEPLPSGTYIICKYVADAAEIHYGQPHIVVTQNDGIVYKRIEQEPGHEKKLLLKSDNPNFKAYTISLNEVSELWEAVGFISTQMPGPHEISQNKIKHLIKDLKNELNGLDGL